MEEEKKSAVENVKAPTDAIDIEDLKKKDAGVLGIKADEKEKYLSDAQFKDTFKCDRNEFYGKKLWR